MTDKPSEAMQRAMRGRGPTRRQQAERTAAIRDGVPRDQQTALGTGRTRRS